ncbi:glutathione S-transferase N-terminal domain-containing protein [Phenylobacterium sp.]|uniref:glutathione S-transferase N-terminal domain-containing protein n=1 Tax=Phenylobacterium sp. TaxID=1871053 RepID=UPI0035B37975
MAADQAVLNDERLTLTGAPGSPYTRKMLAVLRYRRIPYSFDIGAHGRTDLPRPQVQLLPTFYLRGADGAFEAVTDSTPLIRRFETAFAGRNVVPPDPALAFIDALIEDYGDEWLTKAMFHYRWAYEADIDRSARVLPNWRQAAMTDEELARAGEMFAGRQIPRLRYVGSNATTGPVIERSYERFLDAFEEHLRHHRFLMGGRPGASDFGVFGQLTQLALFDPTPMAVTLERAPRVMAWTMMMEDLSGLEPADGDWLDAKALPASLIAVLKEIGRVYPPLLLANAKALMAGAEAVEAVVDGQPWTQQPFTYQGKCLAWLRRDYAALDAGAKASVDRALAGTGCEALV